MSCGICDNRFDLCIDCYNMKAIKNCTLNHGLYFCKNSF